MRLCTPVLIAACLVFSLPTIAGQLQQAPVSAAAPSCWASVKSTIEGYLGRPYVWGGTGLKSFDCSGFVWRVLYENGFMMKRTTARKLYFSLPKPAADATWTPGNIVFFNDLKHCGIVNNSDSFYHAQSSKGTNLSPFSPYWRAQIVGVRCPFQNK